MVLLSLHLVFAPHFSLATFLSPVCFLGVCVSSWNVVSPTMNFLFYFSLAALSVLAVNGDPAEDDWDTIPNSNPGSRRGSLASLGPGTFPLIGLVGPDYGLLSQNHEIPAGQIFINTDEDELHEEEVKRLVDEESASRDEPNPAPEAHESNQSTELGEALKEAIPNQKIASPEAIDSKDADQGIVDPVDSELQSTPPYNAAVKLGTDIPAGETGVSASQEVIPSTKKRPPTVPPRNRGSGQIQQPQSTTITRHSTDADSSSRGPFGQKSEKLFGQRELAAGGREPEELKLFQDFPPPIPSESFESRQNRIFAVPGGSGGERTVSQGVRPIIKKTPPAVPPKKQGLSKVVPIREMYPSIVPPEKQLPRKIVPDEGDQRIANPRNAASKRWRKFGVKLRKSSPQCNVVQVLKNGATIQTYTEC
eukprot:Gregarina_sp_Poly_1__11477@NODE_988_length_5460_cov_35_600223_g694_i0_p1_GENE_NODE_988_length_5460_cov_35_600223_g694_i0NODE_988_length_5460_cov_35_600223_g694_i0_p1_ORF_typecomplete_len421_score56_81_NODE_988_length_5460_cov_35_600223_g694_i026043866